MKRSQSGLAAAMLAVSLFARASAAGTVSPANCVVPSYVVCSPDGGFPFGIVIRDAGGQPLAGVPVDIQFTCYPFTPCPIVCSGCAVTGKIVRATTGSDGVARFDLHVGNGDYCGDISRVQLSAGGYSLGSAYSAYLDMDGDLTVTATDVARVQAWVGLSRPKYDYDGDGHVTAADVAIIQAHLGATCELATANRRPTWGALKGIYR